MQGCDIVGLYAPLLVELSVTNFNFLITQQFANLCEDCFRRQREGE